MPPPEDIDDSFDPAPDPADPFPADALRQGHFLNFQRRTQAIQLAQTGLTLKAIASCLGCSFRTLARERERDLYFRDSLDRAQADAAADPLDRVRRHAASDWRAAAWLLERTRPEEFAPRRTVRLRSDELDAVCERLIAAAVEFLPDFAAREQLHERLRDVAHELQRDLQSDARRPRITRQQQRLATPVTVEQTRVKSALHEPKVDKADTPAGSNESAANPQPSAEQSITPTLWRTAEGCPVHDALAQHHEVSTSPDHPGALENQPEE